MSNNEKLTLQDLIDLLSEKQGINKKDAENFLRELIALTSETIVQGDFVRVKRFGTFKLTKIKARKSIDVNTNETIEIPAHYRLNFVPDKELRDAVNKPFAHYESVLIEEDSPLNDEDEIIDLGAQSPNKEKSIKNIIDVSLDEDSTNDRFESKIEKELEESTPESVTEDPIIENIIVEKEGDFIEPTTDTSSKPLIQVENKDDEIIEEPKRKSKSVPILIACLLIFIGAGTYWWYSNQIKSSDNFISEDKSLMNKKTEEVNLTSPTVDSTQIIQQPDSISQIKETPSEDLKYEEAEIQYNDTMRKLGSKYYGHRSFWVYIYEENKNIIQNPNAVPIGTKLRIPPASKYDIDPKNPESVKRAVELEQKLFREFNL